MLDKFNPPLNIYERIVETTNEGIWLIDDKGATIFVNKKMAEIFGYSREEMLGKTMYDFMEKKDVETAQSNLNKRQNGNSENHDFVFLHKNGSKVYTHISASPFYDNDGKYIGALGLICDISKKRITDGLKEAQKNILEILVKGASLEDALKELVIAIQKLIDNVRCSVLLLDEDGIRLWKGAAPDLPEAYNEAIQGASIGPMAGTCGTSAFRKTLVVVKDAFTDPLWDDYRELAIKYDLRASWSSPILSKDTKVLGTFALYFKTIRTPSEYELEIVKDATNAAALCIEHVRNREKTKQNEKWANFLANARKTLGASLESDIIFSSLNDLVVPELGDWYFLYLKENHQLYSTSKDLKGYFPNLASPEGVSRAMRLREPQLYHLGHLLDEDFLGTKDPKYVKVFQEVGIKSCMALPLIVRGKVLGGIFIASTRHGKTYYDSDLTVASEFTYSLAMAIDNANLYHESKQSIAAREAFIAVASHELRTPLTILRGRIDLLTLMIKKNIIQPEVAEKISPTIQVVHTQVGQFSKLIENLLDISKIGTGNLHLHKENIEVSDLIHDQIEKLKNELEAKNSKIQLNIQKDLMGFWDRSRLEQVITNLLSNAIKFGLGKLIEIDAFRETDFAIIKVKDHGIGISKVDQIRIFDRFERAVSGNYFSGLGLGLYISKEIIYAHGGTIRVESQEELGSCFIVELPLKSL